MSLYVMVTRINAGSLHTPDTFRMLERKVMDRVREECPEVRWLQNMAVCGQYDYVDVFTAPSLEAAMRVSVLVRTYGHADTEIWPAIAWDAFENIVAGLPSTEDARSPVVIAG